MANMRRGREGLASAVLIVALLGAPCLASAEFFEEFGAGYEDRWAYSADDKYTGRFVTDTPEGWQEPGLKVSKLQCLRLMNLPEDIVPKPETASIGFFNANRVDWKSSLLISKWGGCHRPGFCLVCGVLYAFC